jgi:hypothetical protein
VPQWEHTLRAEPILEGDVLLVDGDDRAAEPVGSNFDDEVALGGDLRNGAAPAGLPVAGEHVVAVAVGSVLAMSRSRHRSRLTDDDAWSR